MGLVGSLIVGRRLTKAAPNNYRNDRVSGDHPSLRGALATKQSRGHNMRGASNPDGRTAAPGLLRFARNDGQGIGCVSPKKHWIADAQLIGDHRVVGLLRG